MQDQQTEEMEKKSVEYMQKRAEALQKKMEKIKHKIAVYSGKGGVGKTTVAVNLAVVLAEKGYKVGFLDADIDCPNSHVLFGIKEKTKIEAGMLLPIEKHRVRVVSMSMLADNNKAIMWRGPMLTKAVNDFLFMSEWGELDYLIVDMPPGTSDSPITIMQMLDLDGFLIVTTPQELARMDATRSINMIRNFGKDVIGMVENMCGNVFGCSEDKKYLAHIPMQKEITESCDSGEPIVLGDQKIREIFEGIAKKIAD